MQFSDGVEVAASRSGTGGGGRGGTRFMHSRSRKTVDPRIPMAFLQGRDGAHQVFTDPDRNFVRKCIGGEGSCFLILFRCVVFGHAGLSTGFYCSYTPDVPCKRRTSRDWKLGKSPTMARTINKCLFSSIDRCWPRATTPYFGSVSATTSPRHPKAS